MFPAKAWLEKRYPFRIPPALFARQKARATPAASARREFPAKIWSANRQQQAGGSLKLPASFKRVV
jgi:hypothetical protein